MSLSLVPAVCLVVIMLLSQTDKDASTYNHHSHLKGKYIQKEVNYNTVDKKVSNSQEDYDTIYSYIRKKFTKIDDEDAVKISKNLVEYGEKYDVDPKFAAAVIARESAFKKDAVSVTGAKGLGQIKDFNYKDLKINDPFKIEENVQGTVKYLKKMMKNWNNKSINFVDNDMHKSNDESKVKLALASYYKGFTAVKNTGVDEKTKKYVDDIIDYYDEIIKNQK